MRLIDADKLIAYWGPDHNRLFYADYFIHTLETAPTVKAYLNPKWKRVDGTSDSMCQADKIFCPYCGYSTYPEQVIWKSDKHTIGQLVLPNMCPSCLADMRK